MPDSDDERPRHKHVGHKRSQEFLDWGTTQAQPTMQQPFPGLRIPGRYPDVRPGMQPPDAQHIIRGYTIPFEIANMMGQPAAQNPSQGIYGSDTMMVPAQPNEYIIPAPVVAHKGIEFFDNLIRKTLSQITPTQGQGAGSGSPQRGYAMGGPIPSEGGRGGNFIGGGYPPGDFGGAPVGPWGEPTPLPGTPDGGPMPATTPPPMDWGQGSPTQYGGNYPASWDVGQPSTFSGPAGGYIPAYGGQPSFGPAVNPSTQWVNYPGVGWVPMGIPVNDAGGGNYPGGNPYAGEVSGGFGGNTLGFGGLGSAFSPGGWASGGGTGWGTGGAGGPSYWDVRSN